MDFRFSIKCEMNCKIPVYQKNFKPDCAQHCLSHWSVTSVQVSNLKRSLLIRCQWFVRVYINYSQDQDLDSLLVKCRNDNNSPGPVIRELVPSSHQRSELSNTILCIFSGWDQRIGEGIPIPDSLGEEATFINICFGNGSLKCHRVLIPTTPSFGDKVICWYTGFTFKTFMDINGKLLYNVFLNR